MISRLARYFPPLAWGRGYNRGTLMKDAVAAGIVTLIVIPQSLAYAMLAGLPPQVGLYASILPLVAYALFGSSRTLSVGPVAVVSLMTASAVTRVATPGTELYLETAILLALLSGGILLIMGLLRFGFLANFLSHPVISGFITASCIVIALSQLKYILGIRAQGSTLPELLPDLWYQLPAMNIATLALGCGSLAFLAWSRKKLPALLRRTRLPELPAKMLGLSGPVIAVVLTSALAWWLDLGSLGVELVGQVPSGLPSLALPQIAGLPWRELLPAALLISLIGFVESVSVGHTLAARRRQKIDPDQELVGLGAANVAAAVSGGYPVTGGFSRSAVNFDAGAETPAAGILTAAGLCFAVVVFTPYLAYLPTATLAATVIVAVLSLVDLKVVARAWRFSRSDFSAVALTILATLMLGVEAGVAAGVLASLGMHLYRSSRPHMAVVGEVPGSRHYRNINRHHVAIRSEILSLRIDESLYFANASYVQDRLMDLVAMQPDLRHVVLMCPAVNEIDMSALEVLESINEQLLERDIKLHLSEVKGPVMDLLRATDFLDTLSGRVYLSHHEAVTRLGRELDEASPNPVLNWDI